MGFISSRKINFDGEMVTIFYELVLNRAIVAMGSLLSPTFAYYLLILLC